MAEADKVEEPEFKWGKKRGIGGKSKKVQFYESFTYDGVDYALHDSVYLYKEGEPEPYIGKLIKIWETPDKSKKVKVLWYFRPCEIVNYLGGIEMRENELFLACGEGLGLANINPLEAIVGKCNVVFISNNSRNPQPLEEELQSAEFVFHRFFDVGLRKILDKIDDKISEVEVKNIFNNLDSQKRIGIMSLDKKDISGSDTKCTKGVTGIQPMIDATDGKSFDTIVRQDDDSKPLSGEKDNIDVKQEIKYNDALPTIANDKTTRQVKVEENGVSKASLVKQNSSSKLSHDSRVRIKMEEVAKVDDRRGNISSHKILSRSKDDLEQGENKVVKGHGVEITKGFAEDIASQKEKCEASNEVSKKKIIIYQKETEEVAGVDDRRGNISSQKTISRSKDDLGQGENKVVKGHGVEITKGFVEDIASHKEKCEASKEVPKKKTMNNVSNQRHISKDFGMKATTLSSSKDKYKLQRVKDRSDVEEGPSKKLKIDEKPTKHSGDMLRKESSTVSPDMEKKLEIHASEATRRPDVDRSKWFKGIPWEERMKTAYERGTLVLLQNLDPCLTSEQVQEIIWNGFKESCTARVIQKTAFISPHSGQAFIIFKRKETAEMVVRKLEEDCLLMSNGRPLVGSMGRPCFPEKKPIFYGHHFLDQLRVQREMKDAVSTSHCSQPNTIEYDMGIEWCLQQERADKSWRTLYQRQGEELRKLKAKLKTKI